MQTRQPNLEGAGEIPLRRLVKEALRMRPSRLVVGEVRQEECLDLLIALNSGLPERTKRGRRLGPGRATCSSWSTSLPMMPERRPQPLLHQAGRSARAMTTVLFVPRSTPYLGW